MKKLFIVLILSLFTFATVGLALANDKGPEKVEYSAKMGTVTFNHAQHQERSDCSSCHHTGTFVQCKSCHGVSEEAPKAKDAFHKQCKGCHAEANKGPTKCSGCHVKG